jgi:hypothetical protein
MSPENEKRLQELQAESDKPPPSHIALVFEVLLHRTLIGPSVQSCVE